MAAESKIPQGKIEAVARVLEPQAWAALGIGDTLAYKSRRTSSLRKARHVLEAAAAWDHEHLSEIVTDKAIIRAVQYVAFSVGHDQMRRAIEAALREMLK